MHLSVTSDTTEGERANEIAEEKPWRFDGNAIMVMNDKRGYHMIATS
jgi:hypothetical protein